MRRSPWPQSLAKMGRGAFATLPTEELPGLRVGFGGSAAGPTVSLLRPPCSTLPDSPPDSGSEAYSPQQVNGESSGQRQPPPLGLGKWLVQPYQGEREEGGRGPAAAQRVRLSLVKYSWRWLLFPHGRVGSLVLPQSKCPCWRCHRLSPCAIMDAPFGGKWTAEEGCCWAHLSRVLRGTVAPCGQE